MYTDVENPNDRTIVWEQESDARGVIHDHISRELYNLSHTDRNAIYEEIHGVRCLAVEESPELLAKALYAFQDQLDIATPSKKLIYNKILKLQEKNQANGSDYDEDFRDTADSMDDDAMNHNTATSATKPRRHRRPSFMERDDFRLRFLRCELFDVNKATIRFLNYLNLAYELFGNVALRRQVRAEDFTKEELRFMKLGFIQLLPYRDRAGRRVMAVLGESTSFHQDLFKKALGIRCSLKTYFYIRDVATRDSVESQRKGTVLLLDSSAWDQSGNRTFFSSELYAQTKKVIAAVPTRMVAMHYCFPESPAFRIFNALRIVNSTTLPYLLRVRIHIGNVIENRYKMKGYGIPVHMLPLTETGSIKVKPFYDWIKLRIALEQNETENTRTYNGCKADNGGDSIRSFLSRVVECPSLNDVVFRQGTPSVKNPGNVIFRDKMIGHLEEYYIKQRIWEIPNHQLQVHHIDKFCSWLIYDTEVQRKGRFLEWSKKWNTWVAMIEQDRIKSKVCTSFRDTSRRYFSFRRQAMAKSSPRHPIASSPPPGSTAMDFESVVKSDSEKVYAFVEGGKAATEKKSICFASQESASSTKIDGITLRGDSNFNETGSCWMSS